ncbi:cytochrome c oxidase assembly protein [Nitriliruptoraceae bacterium ZYF776]|nr:cytochrome c oxidase assembly protein [Profundirhabdus halotolerans]
MLLTLDPWWAAWVLDLPALAVAVGWTMLYLRGEKRRRELGSGRPRGTVAYLAGVAVTLLALVSPIAGWSGELLWVHMIQHLLLVVVAAPLLALGAPVATLRLALPPRGRRALARASRASRRARRRIGDPHPIIVATIAHILAMWVWHAPVAYDLAVRYEAVHFLEHVSFFATGVWVWSEIVATARRHQRIQAIATLCLGALIAQGGVLGALLVFAGRSIYEVYTGAGGLTALEDQEFAGALMWVPPSFIYATVAIRRFMAWVDATDRELRQRERRAREQAVRRADAPVVVGPPRPDELRGDGDRSSPPRDPDA